MSLRASSLVGPAHKPAARAKHAVDHDLMQDAGSGRVQHGHLARLTAIKSSPLDNRHDRRAVSGYPGSFCHSSNEI